MARCVGTGVELQRAQTLGSGPKRAVAEIKSKDTPLPCSLKRALPTRPILAVLIMMSTDGLALKRSRLMDSRLLAISSLCILNSQR
jgi:hypothetical protein